MANGIRTGGLRRFSKVRSSVKVPEFDKHLKKAGGNIDRNFGEIKMKTIVRKPLMTLKIHQIILLSSRKFSFFNHPVSQLSGNSQRLSLHFTVDCPWGLRFLLLFRLTVLLLGPCFFSIRYAQTFDEDWKNCLLTVDRFACVGFCWYWF